MASAEIVIGRVCRICKIPTPFDGLVPNKLSRYGYEKLCWQCSKKQTDIWKKKNPHLVSLASKRDYQKHRIERLAKVRVRDLFKNFGLTPKQYDRMYARQRGLCAICNEPEKYIGKNGKVARLAVDHNHRSGALRELLCRRCNLLLGAINEDFDFVNEVLLYLKKHKGL